MTRASQPWALVLRSRPGIHDDILCLWLYKALAEQTCLSDSPKALNKAHGKEELASLLSHQLLHVPKAFYC